MKKIHEKVNIMDSILELRRHFLENVKRGKFEHDLTFSQVEVLNFIGPSGKKTMKEIAAHLRVTPPSATELITEMEKKGLIKRQSDKNDRRIVFIALTASARKFSNSTCRSKEMFFRKTFSKLSKKDLEDLERIIKIMVER